MRRTVMKAAALSLLFVVACAGGVRTTPVGAPIDHACAGLQPAEVDATVDEMWEGAEGVEALREGSGKVPPHTVGAEVRIRAARGVTPQWLARVLACHTARHAVAPGDEGERCPFSLAGVHSDVMPTESGFAVVIRADDPDVAGEVGRRAQALAGRVRPKATAAQTMNTAR